MEIAHGINKRIGVCDIETLRELFDVGVYDMDTEEWIEFEVSKWKNDLYKFTKWYLSKPYDYLVTFNGIGFDQQVLQYIIDNYEKWYDLSNLEICGKIADYASQIIENQDYGLFAQYKEHHFSIPALDIFRIHHFDNEAKRTSLKWCAFMMNMDVEEMPIHYNQENLTQDDIKLIQNYRRNDVIVTKKLFELTLGKVDLPELKDYKGKNKIQDRFDVMNETGMHCLNWSDVKIGEEWNKLNYLKEENITDERTILPKKVVYPYGKKFSKFFPKSMKFTTPLLQNFAKSFGNEYVKAQKQEFPITINNTIFTIAKGGLHSNEKNRMLKPPKGFILRDADVGGQYPNFIIKEPVCPPHLKLTIIRIADRNVKNRSVYKAKAKKLKAEGKDAEARPLMGLQEMLKLCNNGGLFGKLGQQGSFLHYPEGLLRVCIGNEMEILMLIEMMTEAGFKVVSGNTDGIVTMFPEDKEDLYKEICTKWENAVGNIENGKLEYVDFVGLWQDSINSYIGKKIDMDNNGNITGYSVKKKGRFITEFELNKNKSKRIVPLALEAYFIDGKDPIEFIKNHDNIFDFCIAKKSAGDLHYEELLPSGQVKVLKKLIVYYVSNNGNIFKKRGITNTGNDMDNYCEAANKAFPQLGTPKLTYFNKPFTKDKFSDYNIDYSYYIVETLERIDSIEKTKKAKAYVDSLGSSQQGTLW